jgi:lipoprotein NlpD
VKTKNKQIEKLILILSTSSWLFACSHNSPAPVFDIANSNVAGSSAKPLNNKFQPRANPEQQKQHIVRPGDTLFSIAWYYSLDHQALAELNQLNNNIIYPGQRLHLVSTSPQQYFEPESLIAALENEILVRPITSNYTNKSIRGFKSNRREAAKHKKNQSIQTKKNLSSTPIVAPSKLAASRHKNSSAPSNKSLSSSVSRFNKATTNEQSLKWIWPADGKIIARFSAKSNASKGLDIDARRGQPVRATAPGRVVYKGSGLRGYGNLVIIKHSTNYLSAYAHNDKIHVNENEIVKSGQRIADVGSSGTQSEKLHFEIRYKGKPVDPLNYLPQRKF